MDAWLDCLTGLLDWLIRDSGGVDGLLTTLSSTYGSCYGKEGVTETVDVPVGRIRDLVGGVEDRESALGAACDGACHVDVG